MQKCRSCGKKYEGKEEGQTIAGNKRLIMGYGSRHEFDVYQFTLLDGWHCFKCLDREIDQGLCQPIKVWKRQDPYKYHDGCNCPFEWFFPKKQTGTFEERQQVDEDLQKKRWEYYLGPLD